MLFMLFNVKKKIGEFYTGMRLSKRLKTIVTYHTPII